MSNSVTNAKLLNGGQNQDGGQTARNNSNPTASVTVSAGQGREIFSQVNVNLGANLRNADIARRQEKPNSDNKVSDGEKTDWKSIKQGTDSAKTAKIQGTDSAKTSKSQRTNSPETFKNSPDKNAAPNVPANREPKEQTRNNNAAKSNDQPMKSNAENRDSAPKNNNQPAAQNNENRGANPNNQPRAAASNNEQTDGNRNLNSRDNLNSPGNLNSRGESSSTDKSDSREGGNSAKPNNETNDTKIELNHSNNANQSQSNKGRNAEDALANRLNREQEHNETDQNNLSPTKTLPNNTNPAKTAVDVLKNAVENTPLFNNRNQQTANDAPGRNLANMNSPSSRHLNLTINFSVADHPENNSHQQGNQQNGFLGEVISRVFRENDVYLSKNAVKTLVEQRGANAFLNGSENRAFENLPKEVFQLVEAIENQILQTSNQRQIDNKYLSNRVVIELPPELDNQIQAAKNLFTQIFGVSDARHFSQLNIRERMLAAIEMFLRDLPAEMPGNLRNNSAEKILAGFLLARGLVCADGRNQTENLLGMMQSAASDKVSLATMRDFGGLVKALISDAATAKSTANLETAVQKFARILVAINCLDTILTAVKLASQNQFANGNIGRTLAIVQVYELINRLVLAGQNAMKEAAEVAQKNAQFDGAPDKNSRSVFPAKTVADLTETVNKKTGESKNAQAESALRKFLEFNPMLAADKFVSAFENSDDARQAQNDFLNRHQIEIEQWLRSGNHRLVKDIEFEKPIGIVVERGKNDFFSATTARIVLVRDGSVQGWHFLKSFLVA